jgi:hypothetical protein
MESTFQKVILSIAIILLVILLIVINMSLSNATASIVWPPVSTSCPDYWVDIGTTGSGSGCFNSQSIGTCNLPVAGATAAAPGSTVLKNFTGVEFKGNDGLCAKRKWATNCGVTWDGLTYGYGDKQPCINKLPSRFRMPSIFRK